jgi:hypothetical protein
MARGFPASNASTWSGTSQVMMGISSFWEWLRLNIGR